jgi:type II secretory pathway pseudopilin PulG
MFLTCSIRQLKMHQCSGLTLAEVVTSLAITGVIVASVVSGYVFSAQQMELASSSSAAEFMARKRVEQARSAKWDRLAYPPVDELMSSNFPVVAAPLDVPVSANSPQYATNITTISTVSDDPPVKMIRVDCVWSFQTRGPFTNAVIAYRAPDQ